MKKGRSMFSVDNLAFVVSATLLAIALIVAGLILVTAGNHDGRIEGADQPAMETPPGLDANAQVTQVTSTQSVSQSKESITEPIVISGTSGAVRVSFTVVACPDQSADCQK
jgi:hypothetical protein